MKQLITIPRIIGLILIIAGILIYKKTGFAQIALLAIIGLILLLAPKEHSKKQFRNLLESFKLKTEFAWVMFYDAVFCVAIALLGYALYRVLMAVVQPLSQIPVAAGAKLGADNLEMYNNILGAFFTKAIIVLIAFWLLILVAYTISRGFIWLTLLNKPVHLPFFARFSLLNLVWCTAWLVLGMFFVVSMSTKPAAYVFIAMMLLYTHLTAALHYSYTKNRAFGKAMAEAFSTGIGKFKAFVIPYCYVFIVYVLLSQVLLIVSGNLMLAAAFIIFFAFMAWYRTYMRNILRRIS